MEWLTDKEIAELINYKPKKSFHGIIHKKGLVIKSSEFAYKTDEERKKENKKYFEKAHSKWKKK